MNLIILFLKKDKVQDMNINQLKLKVHNTYRKDEKITTSCEPSNDEDVVNKVYLDENLSKIDGNLSFSKNYYNEFRIHYNKQSVEEIYFKEL